MRKVLYLLTFILIIATCGIMLWQWQVYAKDREQSEKRKTTAVEQLIRIEQTNKRLSVEQTIVGLKAGTYKISNPMENAYTIEGRNEMAPASVQVEEGQNQIKFQYDIPFEWNGASQLLTDWAVELENIETVNTKVELTVTADRRAGNWAAGAPLIGKVKKDKIDYYVFENEGPVYPLYYQSKELFYTKTGVNSAIYYEVGEGINIDQVADLLAEISSNQISILTSQHDALNQDDILILDNRLSIDQLKNKLSLIKVNAIFPFQVDEVRWQQFILYNLAENMDLGGVKAKTMVEMIKTGLLEQDVRLFIQSVKELNQPLSAVLLDETLSDALNKKTAFFSLNSKELQEVVPLYFYDERTIAVNGTALEHPIIYLENRKLVPFLTIIEQAGFQYELMDSGEVLLTRAEDMLRMYPDKSVFILNGTDYSVKSTPLTALEGELYIYENWLRDIFGIKLMDQQGVITVVES